MAISLIWAQAANGVLGVGNALPWRIPEDSAHFRDLTMGATVVMGRLTWQSLPPRFRPLPGRRNIVVSRNPSFVADGAAVVPSLEAALVTADEIWVAGGGQIYAEALPFADRLVVTDIDADFDGDAFAPEVGPEWVETRCDPATGWHTSSTGLRFRWRELRRATG